jgi:uncharacterized protein (UPF0335 family)
MAKFGDDEFKFPDELDDDKTKSNDDSDDDIVVDIEDDTPESDRNKKPLPKEVAEDLYNDELEDYSSKVKKKLVQLKKLAHDERREKEAVMREQQESVALAKRLLEENNRLKSTLNHSQKNALDAAKRTVEFEMANAEREYQDAYESGDSAKILEAQKKLNQVSIKADKVANFRATPLQEESIQVQNQPDTTPRVRQDPSAAAWQKENAWFGEDKEMTSLALGLHEKLKEEGVVVSSQEYYRRIDTTMRKRFPEKFENESGSDEDQKPARATRPGQVVAPATRTTAPKRVRLTITQQNIAKKLGLTNEQYAQAQMKLES